ncbi:MAG: metallophosphoesterase family protein [Methanobrevibacter sp.]|nr:metallophosphoesterase family protein [Methanobrevibacter sp.]
MNKVYFCSDFHFCHNRDFLYKPRGFDSVHEMNEQIIKNFNEVMDWTDDLYILGDCFLNNNEEGMSYMRRLPGKKHVIWGNHDTVARQELMWLENFDCLGYANILKYNGYHFYLSHYPTLTSNYDDDKPLKRKTINLCGHSHTKDKFLDFNKGLIYHVELDAHNCYPVLLDDIIKDIKEKLHEKEN